MWISQFKSFGALFRRPHHKSVQRDLFKAWDDFDAGVLTTQKLLRRCSHFVPLAV